MCRMSCITCHVSHVRCHVLSVTFLCNFVVGESVGGSVINGAYPIYFSRFLAFPRLTYLYTEASFLIFWLMSFQYSLGSEPVQCVMISSFFLDEWLSEYIGGLKICTNDYICTEILEYYKCEYLQNIKKKINNWMYKYICGPNF